ncbi:hypothetical protein [Saccharolobus caldissimus]|uniref:Uncharacterized protein n=1 Tax=Saccharolobus caldissimus TaxID=1702097 RepID=A0AAQ4CSJ2_9CREN|nr:hypothetical protein [Saccharolobus caldissimus]BDB98773.1 hypothetical protein SACC_17900 [Saccharolobus caldissimus]
MKKAIALSDDGYYVVFITDKDISYRKTRILNIYYLFFLSIILISILYTIFKIFYILLLVSIPIIVYFLILRIEINVVKPQESEKIINVEIRGNIVKIVTERKTFIIHKRKTILPYY